MKPFTSLLALACILSCTPVLNAAPFLVLDMVYPNPGEPAPKTQFLDPALLARWGFNGNIPREFVQCAVTFDDLETQCFGPLLLGELFEVGKPRQPSAEQGVCHSESVEFVKQDQHRHSRK